MNSITCIVANFAALVLGQWLVTRGHWFGFLVWCAANLYSIVTCVLTGMPQTSVLFGAYFLVNSASLCAWFAKSRATTLTELNPFPSTPATSTGSSRD